MTDICCWALFGSLVPAMCNIYITLILLLWDLSTLCVVDHLWPLIYIYIYIYIYSLILQKCWSAAWFTALHEALLFCHLDDLFGWLLDSDNYHNLLHFSRRFYTYHLKLTNSAKLALLKLFSFVNIRKKWVKKRNRCY